MPATYGIEGGGPPEFAKPSCLGVDEIMGIDVFSVFQVKSGDTWKSLDKFYDGQRGLLRYWLGWGGGGRYANFGIRQLVQSPRGLPADFAASADTYIGSTRVRTEYALGDRNQSWLHADEILNAMPVVGLSRYAVPLSLAKTLLAQGQVDIEQFKLLPDLFDALWYFEMYGLQPRFTAVVPILEEPSEDEVVVECVCDFSKESELEEFTSRVTTLRQSHSAVRVVYGFA